ncbi:MAG: MMPL family transporter [Actinobacteria bacterium]|nr:MMPL family transporter [Actinomycetota bacterium]
MSSVLHRLARASYRARGRVLAAWAALLAVLGLLALLVGGSFDDEFSIPGASSQVALDQLRMTFPEAAEASATMVVLAPEDATVGDPAVRDAVEVAARRIAGITWVTDVQLPWDETGGGLISESGAAATVSIRVGDLQVSTFTDEQRALLVAEAAELEEAIPGGAVHVGGDLFAVSMPEMSAMDFAGVLVALVVLLVVLGSLEAALMPVLLSLVGAGASMLLVVIAAGLATINSTTMILALMLALAVGIDYGLLIVARHRDQLATGMALEESVARATATAGSAVVFAGVTNVIALAGMAVAQLPFLTIMGAFASLAVTIEVALALTALPALLGVAGERLRPTTSRTSRRPGAASRWWVGVVTRLPLLTVVIVVAGLAALSLPARDLELALPNSGRNPPGAADRITFDLIAEHFGPGRNGPLIVTGTIVESDDPLGVVEGIRRDILNLPGVAEVPLAVPNRNADTALVQVIPETGPDDPATARLVEDLRALAPEWEGRYGVETAITGYTAASIDISARLAAALLPFGVFVVGLTLVLLLLVFRSIPVSVKTAASYLLSVGGAFGATALVFNQGWFMQVVNLRETAPVISFLPIILMGILFGLSMDYEMFLSSRMREEWVHGNRTTWIEEGFAHSAKVVVAAALIMISVFAFFVPFGEGVIKPIAFGLAVGVAIDAFLVRMTLGPAIMRLLGRHAWWLPRWLDARLPELDVEGEAILHQLRLATWPFPGATHAIHGEGLGVVARGRELFAGVEVDLQPGEAMVVTGEATARRALLLALTGRLRLTAGDLKVLGLALPEQAGELRRRATFVDGAARDTARMLADPVGDLVVVDDADRLPAPGRAALARLAGHRTLVLGTSDGATITDLLAPAGDVVAVGGAT